MVSKGNHPQMALIQVSEILEFTQIEWIWAVLHCWTPMKLRQSVAVRAVHVRRILMVSDKGSLKLGIIIWKEIPFQIPPKTLQDSRINSACYMIFPSVFPHGFCPIHSEKAEARLHRESWGSQSRWGWGVYRASSTALRIGRLGIIPIGPTRWLSSCNVHVIWMGVFFFNVFVFFFLPVLTIFSYDKCNGD